MARRDLARAALAAAVGALTALAALTIGPARAADAPSGVNAGAKWTLAHPIERGLKNQMKLYVVEDHRLPVVTFRFAIRAGSADEPAEKAGLANFMLDAMRRGTERRDADALEQAVAATGGEIESPSRAGSCRASGAPGSTSSPTSFSTRPSAARTSRKRAPP